MKKSILSLATALFISNFGFAQFRATDKTGINVFETPKTETEFTGVKMDFGGGFTQGFQNLSHTNTADPNLVGGVDKNKLLPIEGGFNLASANLIMKTQLADGVALNMELYLASKHHNETWVKGGFIQFDKLSFLKMDFIDNIMEYTTIKVGQMEVNYGDAHFRRSDGGNAIYNPFVENYIMDAFATEIGVEADINYNGIVGVAAITNGLLKGNVNVQAPIAGATNGKKSASLILKLGYDKQLNEDLRIRITGSGYYTPGAIGNTLFSGDRTGSNYYSIMDNLPYSTTASATTSTAFTNGRYNPGLTDKLSSVTGNLFVKFHGLEWFSTLESATGRAKAETTGDRNATQLATDLVYRFGSNENFWVGFRYNTLTADVAATTPYDVTINRVAGSAGWFVTNNVMTKLEYVTQDYKDYPSSSIFNGGNFKGLSLQAVVGF